MFVHADDSKFTILLFFCTVWIYNPVKDLTGYRFLLTLVELLTCLVLSSYENVLCVVLALNFMLNNFQLN